MRKREQAPTCSILQKEVKVEVQQKCLEICAVVFVLQRILGQIKLFPYQGCCPLQGLFCASKLHVGWEGSQEEACHQGHSHFIPCLPRHVRLQTVPTSSMWQFVSATSTQTQPPGPQSCASPVVGWPGWKDAHLCSWSWEFVSSRLETPSGTGWVEAIFEAEIKSKLYKSELHSLHTQKKNKKPWQHRNHVFLETKRVFFAQFRLNRLDPGDVLFFSKDPKARTWLTEWLPRMLPRSLTDWLVIFCRVDVGDISGGWKVKANSQQRSLLFIQHTHFEPNRRCRIHPPTKKLIP